MRSKEESSPAEIEVRGDEPIPRSVTLEQLLAQITDENLHGEIETGPPVGNEVALAEFDAEARFRARAALGSCEEGLRIIDELDRGD